MARPVKARQRTWAAPPSCSAYCCASVFRRAPLHRSPAFSVCVYCGSTPGEEPFWADCTRRIQHLDQPTSPGNSSTSGGRSGLMGLVAEATRILQWTRGGVIPTALVDRNWQCARWGCGPARCTSARHDMPARLLSTSVQAGFASEWQMGLVRVDADASAAACAGARGWHGADGTCWLNGSEAAVQRGSARWRSASYRQTPLATDTLETLDRALHRNAHQLIAGLAGEAVACATHNTSILAIDLSRRAGRIVTARIALAGSPSVRAGWSP